MSNYNALTNTTNSLLIIKLTHIFKTVFFFFSATSVLAYETASECRHVSVCVCEKDRDLCSFMCAFLYVCV